MFRHLMLILLIATLTIGAGCQSITHAPHRSRAEDTPSKSTCGECGEHVDADCTSLRCTPGLSTGCGESTEGCDSDRQACDFEYGRKHLALDGAGWIAGIPSKLILWNTRVDSHSVSEETADELRQYLREKQLTDVKVRVNQYAPIQEWKRLVSNQEIHPGWRYTVGAWSLTKYTLLPGRIFGGDEYNPFTNTISLYSDRASLALREAARAKQVQEANWKGLYSASLFVPGSPIWTDTLATRDVLAYAKETGQPSLEREVYLVLFPAWGSRVGGSAFLYANAGQAQLLQGSLALVGHAVGRTMGAYVSEDSVQMAKAVMGIVRQPDPEEPVQVEIQESLPPFEPYSVSFVPVDVEYDLFP